MTLLKSADINVLISIDHCPSLHPNCSSNSYLLSLLFPYLPSPSFVSPFLFSARVGRDNTYYHVSLVLSTTRTRGPRGPRPGSRPRSQPDDGCGPSSADVVN